MADEPNTQDTQQPNPGAAGLVQQDSGITFEGEGRPDFLPPEVTDRATFTEWYNKTVGAKSAFDGTDATTPKLDDQGRTVDADGKPIEAPTEEATKKPTEEQASSDKPARTDEEITAALQAQGGIFAKAEYLPAALEFERTGDVSEATLATTAAALGVPLEAAKSFVEAQKVAREALAKLTEATTTQVASAQDLAVKSALDAIVPDDAEYAKVLEWGKGALTAGEKEAYDKAMSSKDAVTAGALLAGIYERYKAAGNGPAPRDIASEGQRAPTTNTNGPQPFASQAEATAAQRDPRYQTDDTYRNAVIARIKVSPF